MTQEEKLKLAEAVRSSNSVEPFTPDVYLECREKVDVQETWIPTSGGDAHVYFIRQKDQTGTLPLYINIHGGGFVRYHFPRDIFFSSRMACETGCMVIDVDYKLAPEYPYPTAVNECYDIVKWAMEHAEELNIDPARVAVGGHSSGATITAALALKANQTKEFQIRMQILDYPPMDVYTDPAKKRVPGDVIISAERARAYNALYVEPERANEPYASPVFATKEMLVGLPETLVITAGKDMLRFEAKQYVEMLREAGVEVTTQEFAQSNHGFTVNCLDEYEGAQQLYIEMLKKAFQTVV